MGSWVKLPRGSVGSWVKKIMTWVRGSLLLVGPWVRGSQKITCVRGSEKLRGFVGPNNHVGVSGFKKSRVFVVSIARGFKNCVKMPRVFVGL